MTDIAFTVSGLIFAAVLGLAFIFGFYMSGRKK
jgi:hypothetical protein